MPSCLVVQHVEPERPYAIGEALSDAGAELVLRRTYVPEPLPRHIGDFDGLVVMGGPMSAASGEGFATHGQEIRLLAEAIDIGLPTLGVCLGAQLLAAAAGGRVVPGRVGPEIGWAPVRFSAAAARDPLFAATPAELTVLHWHGDTYELPPGAVHLASSASYAQQAFRVGAAAWGLQFHVEVDHAAVEAFVRAFCQDANEAGTNPAVIRAATPGALRALAPHRLEVLARFAALVASSSARLGEDSVDQLADHC
jgi:GMP synthase-like glutamine amidotransferase